MNESLVKNRGLTSLSLAHSKFSSAAAEGFTDMLSENRSLRILSLAGAIIGDEGTVTGFLLAGVGHTLRLYDIGKKAWERVTVDSYIPCHRCNWWDAEVRAR